MIWWILLAGWVAIQLPFILAMARYRKLASGYPLRVTSSLLIPGSRYWRSQVKVEDQASMERYRRLLLIYYYLVFLAPLFLLFGALAIVET